MTDETKRIVDAIRAEVEWARGLPWDTSAAALLLGICDRLESGDHLKDKTE